MTTPIDSTVRSQRRLAATLALVAGYVDAFTLLTYKVYASFMSGNTTQAGLRVGQGQFADAVLRLTPIPCFVIGVIVGTYALQVPCRHPVRRLSGYVAVFLVGAMAIGRLGPLAAWLCIVGLSFAMGVMNTIISHVGNQSVSLGFVTGDLNNLGRRLALAGRGAPLPDSQGPWDSHWWRVRVLAEVWGAFFLGAALAGAGMLMVDRWILAPPAVVLAFVALSDFGAKKSDDAPVLDELRPSRGAHPPNRVPEV